MALLLESLDSVIGSDRFDEYRRGLEEPSLKAIESLFLFDLRLRILCLQGLGIIELFLVNRLQIKPDGKYFTSFGAVRKMIMKLPKSEQYSFAKQLGLHNPREFAGVLRNLVHLRNLAAHHQRIWNRNFQFEIPGKTFSDLKLLAPIKNPYSLATSLVALIYLLGRLPKILDLQGELDILLDESLLGRNFLLKNMGFEIP